MSGRGRVEHRSSFKRHELPTDVIEAVLSLQSALKHHAKMMLRADAARTPLQREDAHRLIGEAARAIQGAEEVLRVVLSD